MALEETQIRILEGSSIKRSQGDNWDSREEVIKEGRKEGWR